MTQARCRHGLKTAGCGESGSSSSPTVYVSGGGRVYHQRRNCENLMQGKRLVDEWGGTAAAVRVTREKLAIAEYRAQPRLQVHESVDRCRSPRSRSWVASNAE